MNDHNLEIVEDVSNCMAELTGQYQNFSLIGKYLPILWIIYIWYVPLAIRPRYFAFGNLWNLLHALAASRSFPMSY